MTADDGGPKYIRSADSNISGPQVRRSSKVSSILKGFASGPPSSRVLREVLKHKMNFDFVSDWYDTIVSSEDPLGRPFYHFSILCFVCTIVSEDPGPPTSGA